MDRWRCGATRADRAPGHAHFVGIAGRGTSGLAQVLVQHGVRVTGSEPGASPAVARLRQLGARVHTGHGPASKPRSWLRRAHFVIYSPEVARIHPERLVAARCGVVQGSSAEWLGCLMRRRIGLGLVGGRAATAASAMIGWTLMRVGLDPTVVVGSVVPQLGGWARLGTGPHGVVEVIETTEGLGPTAPRLAVLLDVAPRPGSDPAAWAEALHRFVATVPGDGLVLALEHDEAARAVLRDLAPAVEWISLERGSDWWGTDLRQEQGRYRFRAFRRGRFAVEVRLQVPGRRNVLSALAAVAACDRLDVPTLEIKQGLEEFAGLARDFESRGSYRGVTLVDDAGLDASAIAEALAVGRQMFGPRRLWAVFLAMEVRFGPGDPDRYGAAFAAADHVLIIEARLPAHPPPSAGDGSRALVRALVAAGVRARWMPSLDDAIRDLDRHLEPGDVLLTLGTGDVGMIADAFIRRLPRNRPGR